MHPAAGPRTSQNRCGWLDTFRIALGDFILLDYFFDWIFGTDTVQRVPFDELRVESPNLGMLYQATRAVALWRVFRRLGLGRDRVLLDLGSGKGRVLLVAAACGFKEAHGVEWSGELCAIAERNIAAYRQRTGSKTEFKVLHGDAAEYPIQSTEDVFFLYEPFADIIWTKVIRNIRKSLQTCPRKIWIIYHSMPKSSWYIVQRESAFIYQFKYHSFRQWFTVFSNQT